MLLADVYSKHGEALEADFFIHYHQDINHMSLRRMRNFFFRLPANSQTKCEIAGIPEEARAWDTNTYMLANVIDALQAIDWRLIAVNSKHPPKPPKPFPRPRIEKETRKPKGYWPGRTIVDKG